MKKNPGFEEAMDRIEEIAGLLSSGGATLDEALVLYTEASALIKQCEKKLDEASLKMEKLLPKSKPGPDCEETGDDD